MLLLKEENFEKKFMKKRKEKISVPLSLSFLRWMTVKILGLFYFCDEIVNGNIMITLPFDVKRQNIL